MKPTIIYEDNLLAFVQKNASYIKGNITKYIAPKLFYGDIEILQTKS